MLFRSHLSPGSIDGLLGIRAIAPMKSFMATKLWPEMLQGTSIVNNVTDVGQRQVS